MATKKLIAGVRSTVYKSRRRYSRVVVDEVEQLFFQGKEIRYLKLDVRRVRTNRSLQAAILGNQLGQTPYVRGRTYSFAAAIPVGEISYPTVSSPRVFEM